MKENSRLEALEIVDMAAPETCRLTTGDRRGENMVVSLLSWKESSSNDSESFSRASVS